MKALRLTTLYRTQHQIGFHVQRSLHTSIRATKEQDAPVSKPVLRLQTDPTKSDYVHPKEEFYWNPTRTDRFFLVLTGFYKSRNEIPDILPRTLYKRFQLRYRFYQFLIFAILFCMVIIVPLSVVARYQIKLARREIPTLEESLQMKNQRERANGQERATK